MGVRLPLARGLHGVPAALALSLVLSAPAVNQERSPIEVLHIGTHDSAGAGDRDNSGAGALDTLRHFIKTETGFDNDITRYKDWRVMAEKVVNGRLHLGVFEGYEFAWAREKHERLRPLAVAVNVYRYPVVYVMARNDHKTGGFAGLRGRVLAEPAVGNGYLRFFVDRCCRAEGKEPREFFSALTTPDNVEDALDDVVDGVIEAVVIDRAGLEAFRRRKPARFERLKEVARSKPLPPPVVAYQEGVLSDQALERLRDGLLGARGKERGQTLLTMFRFTSFDAVPEDLDRVLKETRKAYPADGAAGGGRSARKSLDD